MERGFEYRGGPVSEECLHRALSFLISLESEEDDETFDYESCVKENQESYDMAEAAIRKFGEQIRPQTLEVMQQVYYSVVNSPRYSELGALRSVVSSTLNGCWNGIGEWRS